MWGDLIDGVGYFIGEKPCVLILLIIVLIISRAIQCAREKIMHMVIIFTILI